MIPILVDHFSRVFRWVVVVVVMAGGTAHAQQVTSGFLFGGATFGKVDGAGRFGGGLDFELTPSLDLGGEIGTIHKRDVGVLASANIGYHFDGRRDSGWDPFFTAGVSGARLGGRGGLYLNLGMGMNYWVRPTWAFRGEFKGYPGGQDLGGFAEFRFGVTFKPR